MCEMSPLVDRISQGQDFATVKAMKRPLLYAEDCRNMTRETVKAPGERHFEQTLTNWLHQFPRHALEAKRSRESGGVKSIDIGQNFLPCPCSLRCRVTILR